MNKTRNLALLIMVFFICSGCVTYFGNDGPYEGKVVDADTNQPIEGAVVHGEWYEAHPGPGGATHTDYDSREVLTDKNGEFKIPGHGLLFFSNIEPIDVTVLKAGYTQVFAYIWGLSTNFEVEILGNNKAVFKLRKMTMEERRERSINEPSQIVIKNMKLFRQEFNKEINEIGRSSEYLYPVE